MTGRAPIVVVRTSHRLHGMGRELEDGQASACPLTQEEACQGRSAQGHQDHRQQSERVVGSRKSPRIAGEVPVRAMCELYLEYIQRECGSLNRCKRACRSRPVRRTLIRMPHIEAPERVASRSSAHGGDRGRRHRPSSGEWPK